MQSTTNLTLKCKLVGSDELRRRTISLVDGAIQTDELKATIAELFNLSPNTFKMFYRDDDDDLVTIESDDDIQEALTIVQLAAPKPILRLEVRPISEPEQSEPEQSELVTTEDTAVEAESVNNESAFIMVAPSQLSNELRQAILASFTAEYVDDVEGAVGDYLTDPDTDLSSFGVHGEWIVEHQYERRVFKVRQAGGVEAAVAEIARLDAEMQEPDWTMPSGVEVPTDMRADILQALTREYVEDIDGAVGLYFESLGSELEELLGRGADGMLERHLERRVRQARECSVEAATSVIAVIDAEDWSLILPPRRNDSDSDSGSDSSDPSDSDSDSSDDELVVVESEAEHVGIWCDECHMKPLRGARFTKQLIHDTFDLCQGCFNHLSKSEQADFKQATAPTWSQDAELEAARAADEEEATRAAAEEEAARAAAEEEAARAAAEEEAARAATEEEAACAAAEEEAACAAAEEEAARAAAEEEVACLSAEEEVAEADHVWEGIWCDGCETKPLCGARFMKQLQNDSFDLCAACFAKLSDPEQAEFQPVEPQLNEATAQVPIGEAVSSPIAPDVCAFEAGDEAIYTPTGETVTVLVVHFDDAPNTYFTIRMAQGSERQTSAERLIKPSEAHHASQANEDASMAPVLDCTDLSASCIADIQVGLDQEQSAEAEAARVAAEAEAAREAAEAVMQAAREAACEAEAVREAAEAAREAAHVLSVPVEWQSLIQALKDMGFSSSVATDSIVKAEGNLDVALEVALNYVPPAPPAAALVTIRSESVWEEAWDLVLLELEEMGFCDVESNKHFVESNNGDLKATVTTLIANERSKR